jgi:DNA-binding response OmpR family regulator
MNAHTKIDETAALRRRVEELEEEVCYLRGLLRPETDCLERLALGLQPQEWRILQSIRSASPRVVSYERFFASLESGAENELAVLKMRVFTLRRKLREHRVVIRTARGVGLFMDAENRARLEAILENSTKKHGETKC